MPSWLRVRDFAVAWLIALLGGACSDAGVVTAPVAEQTDVEQPPEDIAVVVDTARVAPKPDVAAEVKAEVAVAPDADVAPDVVADVVATADADVAPEAAAEIAAEPAPEVVAPPPDVPPPDLEQPAPELPPAEVAAPDLPPDVPEPPDVAVDVELAEPDLAPPDVAEPEVAAPDIAPDIAPEVFVPCPKGCDDANICTVDLCDDVSGCTHTANNLACNDDLLCTVGDTCGGGVCVSGPAKDCADAYVCTSDACDPKTGLCNHVVTQAPCDDGDNCTFDDFCFSPTCAGKPMSCNDNNDCTIDSCTAATGCKHIAVANAQGCNDGLACTPQDTCSGSACVGIGNKCDDKNICTSDICSEPGGACTHSAIKSPCDDGKACTELDHCVDGSCLGTPTVCNDANPCTADICDAGKGGCQFSALSGLCDDGDACTTGDTCKGTTCTAGTSVTCNASAPCTVATCDTKTGKCVSAAASDKTPCGTTTGCTSNSVCLAGACTVGTGDGCNDGNACTQDACVAGACTHTNASGACSDGLACTSADTCANGKCAGKTLNCEDDNACTTGTCSPTTGGCVQAATQGIACSDGDPCTVGDLCSAGTCQSGLPLDCDDGKLCTVDTCNPSGCIHVVQPNGGECNDGDICSAGDECIDQVCKSFGTLNCNDNNDCTLDVCVAKIGCQHMTQNVPCSDGSCCTAGDHCQEGQCVSTKTTTCDDGLACTVDACAPLDGCVFSPGGAGCGVCMSDDFEGPQTQWAAWAEDPTYVQWVVSGVHPRSGVKSIRAQWKGPAPSGTTTSKAAYFRLRKVVLNDPSWLAFDFSNKALTQGCAADTMHIVVNGKEVWSHCNGKPGETGNPLGTCTDYQHIVVPLSGGANNFTGAPVDIDFRLDAGWIQGAGGSMDIDNVQILGACDSACLGVDLEIHDPGYKVGDKLPKFIMPGWPQTNSDPAYQAWKRVETGGHTGVAALQAGWSGTPPKGTAATTSLKIPNLTVEPGAKLRFWVNTTGFGDPSCGDDDFEVLVGDKLVYARCDDTGKWLQTEIDLAPWVGKLTTLEFRARSGATPASKGVVTLDDWAITGDCTFRCYFEDFSAGLGEWTSTQAKGLPAWKASPVANSPPQALMVDLSGAVADGSKITLGQAPLSVFWLPVRGAIWRAQVNIEATSDACPAAILTSRGQAVGKKSAKGAPSTGPSADQGTLCAATTGWKQWSGDFAGVTLGRESTLALVASKPVGVAPIVRVDDVEILCR